jgi:HEAT repeat protein
VRNAALRALASFLMAVDEPAQRTPFQELVPAMLQTISDALAQNMEEECRDALEVFVEVAESQTKFLKKHLDACVNGMISIASNTNLDDSLRHLALEFLLTIAENAPTLARKMPRFCSDTVPVALAMMLELECDTPEELAEWENEDEDEDDTDVTNYDVGEEALDRLAIALGGKAMMPVLFGVIQEWFPSEDWKRRHAALMAISQSGEGCEAQMAKQLELIVTTIVTRFGDQHPRVRWAAINTIGQMSTDFGPALQAKLHSCVLPALVSAMDDGCKRVQAHAAAAVINFCEHCDRKTLHPYLPGLLGKLMQLLSTNQHRVQEQAVTAVASVADVAESDFTPFYEAFIPGLKDLLRKPGGKELRMLRGKAMECVSLIGVAVGKEKFGPDAKEVMELLIQTQQGVELDADDPQVSFMLQACARICKCLGEHFQPYLPFVIPPLLTSAQLDPELHVTDVDEEEVDVEEEEGMESVTVNIRGQGNKRITIRTSALEEKATACSMLHSYIADMKEAFFP